MNIGKVAVKSIAWNGLSQLGFQGIRLIFIILLAKYFLGPSEFGLITMITVITGYSEVLLNFGFGEAIIQKKKITHNDLCSVFWLNCLLGLIITTIIYFSSSAISSFYDQPKLYRLIKYIAPIYFINSLNIVQRSYLLKQLDFKRLAIIDLVSVICSASLALYLASIGVGVVVLVIFQIALACVNFLFFWVVFDSWNPSFIFKWTSIKSILNFSMNRFGTASFNYATNKYDKGVIGKNIGSEALGVYQQAYQFVLLPFQTIVSIVFKVFFPLISKYQNNLELVNKLYIFLTRSVFIFMAPITLIIYYFAPTIVSTVFGSKWIEMIPLIQLFSFLPTFLLLRGLQRVFLLSMGYAGLLFKLNLVYNVLTVVLISVYSRAGVNILAQIVILSLSLTCVLNIIFVLKKLKISYFSYVRELIGSSLIWILLIVSTYFLSSAISVYLLPLTIIISFIIFVLIIDNKLFFDLLKYKNI